MPEPITTTALALAKKAADELSPDTADFAAQISGAGRNELGAWFADHVRLRRLKSQLKIVERAKVYCDEAGVSPSTVKLTVLVPLLESASLEEDEALGDKWAALLANAATGKAVVDPAYPDILRQLTPVDAALLNRLFEIQANMPAGQRHIIGIRCIALRQEQGLSEVDFMRHLDNLYRLRLAAPASMAKIDASAGVPEKHFADAGYVATYMTPLGEAFVRACSPPANDPS